MTDDFTANFTALCGRAPYRWQQRLYSDFIARRPVDALDLPTGLGKTSVMTIWLLARAAGADVPRRLVYVVDRRAVADQASAEAEDLCRQLTRTDGRMAALRTALRLTPEGLPVSTLRGQLADNKVWLQRPEGPAIVVGTVDMIGSRLLFSGYGVSRRMRPVHAALLGIDALLVLDEAHLVPPFEALLQSSATIAHAFQRAMPLPVPTLRVLTLSATGRTAQGNCFALQSEDLSDPPVANRLGAAKALRLHPPVALAGLAPALVALALQRAADGSAVLVFCNSRKVAQEVGKAVAAGLAVNRDKTPRVAFLVGERRVHERMALADSAVFARFRPGRQVSADGVGASMSGPVCLVATSAGEVGVDLDADHMVCDLVPWERMVQRLGRVNRRPVAGRAYVDVVPAEQPADKAVEQTVTELDRFSAPFRCQAWQVDCDGCLDASTGALLALREVTGFAELALAATTEAPLYPALTLPHLQAWAMTSLKQHFGRTLVAPWLRGWVDDEPQCRVVWRALMPLRRLPSGQVDDSRNARRAADDFFATAVPHLSESLDAPAWRVAEWLKARAKAVHKSHAGAAAVPAVCVLDTDGSVFRIIGSETLPDDLDRTLSGRQLIVDARLGGLDDDGLLDAKADAVPTTLDDGVSWTPSVETIGFRVRVFRSDAVDEEDDDWRVQFAWSYQDDAELPEFVVEVLRASGTGEGDPALARWAQRLGEHQAWAARHAAAIAAEIGCAAEAAHTLVLAAAGHDEGKRRSEWQRALGMRSDGKDAWAKSGRRGAADALPANLRDGRPAPALMAGYRHEFGSVRDLLSAAADRLPRPDSHDWRDLCLHIVAAHHGHARPTIPADDPASLPSASAALAREIALRQARLEARWGPWALAWWEALLQSADWRASAELNEAGNG